MNALLWIMPAAFSQMISGEKNTKDRSLSFGVFAGPAWAYEDKAYLWSPQVSVLVDLRLKQDFFIRSAPTYTWLMKWNEHYLALPLQLGKTLNHKWSFYAGPAFIMDVGFFHDLGFAGGMTRHLNRHHAISLSAFRFTLYDYHIDYLYIPVCLGYQFNF